MFSHFGHKLQEELDAIREPTAKEREGSFDDDMDDTMDTGEGTVQRTTRGIANLGSQLQQAQATGMYEGLERYKQDHDGQLGPGDAAFERLKEAREDHAAHEAEREAQPGMGFPGMKGM